MVVNVLLFIPLGAALRLVGVPGHRTLGIAALLSAIIELAQTVIPGRDPNLGDVLFNVVGAGGGSVALLVARRMAPLKPSAAARASAAASASVAAAVLMTGILLRPSFPIRTYFGQWTPYLGHLEWYRGRVHSAFVGEIPIRPFQLETSDTIRVLLLAGSPIRVVATAGPPVDGLGSLVSIYDRRRTEIVLVGPDRDDLVFRFRTRARDFRLDQPDLRLKGGMRGIAQGTPLSVRVWRPASGRYCIEVNEREGCEIGFSVGAGWGLLLYVESLPPWAKHLFDGAWLAILALPVGLWLRLRWESALALMIVAAALWLLPGVWGLLPAGPGLSFAAAIGLSAGMWVGRKLRPRAPAVA